MASSALALVNTDFETGSLTPWTTVGEVALSATGGHLGAKCASFNTAAITGANASIYQDVTITAGADTCFFSVWALSERGFGATCTLVIESLDGGNSVLSSYSGAPFTDNTALTWNQRGLVAPIHASAVKVRLKVTMTKEATGGYAQIDGGMVALQFSPSLGSAFYLAGAGNHRVARRGPRRLVAPFTLQRSAQYRRAVYAGTTTSTQRTAPYPKALYAATPSSVYRTGSRRTLGAALTGPSVRRAIGAHRWAGNKLLTATAGSRAAHNKMRVTLPIFLKRRTKLNPGINS